MAPLPSFRHASARKQRACQSLTLSRVDAYVDYTAEVEADSAEEAVDLAYDGLVPLDWAERGVVEFDARHVVALDANGDELDGYSRGKG